jgi:hypothetical protein
MRDSVLEEVTPVILTYDEAPNIARTLAKLQWAKASSLWTVVVLTHALGCSAARVGPHSPATFRFPRESMELRNFANGH